MHRERFHDPARIVEPDKNGWCWHCRIAFPKVYVLNNASPSTARALKSGLHERFSACDVISHRALRATRKPRCFVRGTNRPIVLISMDARSVEATAQIVPQPATRANEGHLTLLVVLIPQTLRQILCPDTFNPELGQSVLDALTQLTDIQDQIRRDGLFHRLAQPQEELENASRWVRMNRQANILMALSERIKGADGEEGQQKLRRDALIAETTLDKIIQSRPPAASLSHPAHLLSPRQQSFYLL